MRHIQRSTAGLRPDIMRPRDSPHVERTSRLHSLWPGGHDLVAQHAGQRHARLVESLSHGEAARPAAYRILPFDRVPRHFDERPSQPRRPVTRNAAAIDAIGAAVDARDEAGITRQRGAAREPRDVTDLRADGSCHDRPDPDQIRQGHGDGVGRGSLPHLDIGRVGIDMYRSIEAVEPSQCAVRVRRQRHRG